MSVPKFMGHWHRVEILEATDPALKQYEGKSVQEVAEMRGADGLDTFLDLAVEDDLNLQYIMPQYHEEGIQQLISDPRTMIGLSDGGAHVDMLCDAGYAKYLLGNWVRKRKAITLEFAIKRITSEPANFFGIRHRGQLRQGWKADITVFDHNTVNSARRAKMAYDLPGGGRRLVMPAEGIEYTIVNGRMSYDHGKRSGASAGEVMRSKPGFIVLSQTLGREASGKPLRLHQVGLHHFAFWVDNLESRVEKLKNAGVKILVPPYAADTIAYDEKTGGKVLTCLFEDPDGTILQFDQRLN